MSDKPFWLLGREKIRDAYEKYGPELEKGVRLSPYDLGIEWEMTPIEDNVWGNIRFLGLPLYPQYPIGKYFVDFADPFRKIAIEVDSKKWHQDKAKDALREVELWRANWKVHRISGWMTYATEMSFEDEDGNINFKRYVEESSEGFLRNLYGRYFPRIGVEVQDDL